MTPGGLLVFTGAGISQESGIPTFEELGDLRSKLSRSYFRKEPEAFYGILLTLHERLESARPNAAHLAIAEASLPVITMNIDGLHQKAGTEAIIEIHGGMTWVDCPQCRAAYPFAKVRESVRCPECMKVLEPRVVLYEDSLTELSMAYRWVDQAEALLVVGTSFYTSTASYITDRARRNGIPVHVINAEAGTAVPRYIETYRINTNRG